ncbi:MAG TPA: hypothetical protein V6C90_08535 [Coleofasciculaceae cyanobacterium]
MVVRSGYANAFEQPIRSVLETAIALKVFFFFYIHGLIGRTIRIHR